MNILVLGSDTVEKNLVGLCRKSKFLDHIYTASSEPLQDTPNVEYVDYIDLIYKIKALQIDLVLLADKFLIEDGLVELLKKNFINVISVNSKWLNLENCRRAAKQLMDYYSINNPTLIKAPMSFPIVFKTDLPKITKIVYSMQELIELKEKNNEGITFLEECLKGDLKELMAFWDGKNLIHFDKKEGLTEVQADRLELLKTKMAFMFSDEKADFVGFFNTKLVWSKNDWHVLDFVMHIDESFNLELLDKDFLYILNSAIYQKLNEINF